MRIVDFGLASSGYSVRLWREMRGFYYRYTRLTREREGHEPRELIVKQWNGNKEDNVPFFLQVSYSDPPITNKLLTMSSNRRFSHRK
jgi:hypothetical protein